MDSPPSSTGSRTILRHRLDNEPESIDDLLATVSEQLVSRELLDEADATRVMGAVDEALKNAQLHGNLELDSALRDRLDGAFDELAELRRRLSPYRDRRVDFAMEVDATEIRFTIGDEGTGFNVDALPDPTSIECLERSYGRGILMMRAFADDVRYNDVGNVVTLVKHR